VSAPLAAPAWGDGGTVVQPRQPAFWLLAVLIAAGAIRIGILVAQAFALHPAAAFLAGALLTLYAIPFLLFVNRLDLFEREPATMVAAAFAWGGLVATSAALPGNEAVVGLATKLVSADFAVRWGPALAGPTTEELLKVLGVVVLALVARDEFDSPLDGMVYGALVGLGFQVVESFVACINAVTVAGGHDQVVPVLQVFLVRALVGLWSHAAYTAISGYGVGYAVCRRDRTWTERIGVAALCFGLAYFAHFLWNAPPLTDAFGEGFGLVVAVLAKGIPVLLLLVVMYRMARHEEATWFRRAVAGEVGTDVLLADELEELMTLARRRDVIRMVRSIRGRRAARLVEELQQAQLALGVACSRGPAAGADEAEAARRRIRALRVELAHAGVERAGTLPHGAEGGSGAVR
jgi:RsiW-degrading membrane proteinase PrsW (M82 family)